jgi:SanA protein
LTRPIRLVATGAAIVALLLLSLLALAAMARTTIDAWGRAYVVDRLEGVLPVDTALVLGTAPFGVRGQDQRTLSRRLDTAAGLWHGGTVGHFIVSGIRIGEDYDEASVMRDELVERGVPPEAIELDQHGDRTWDSIARARYVFGKRRLVIVSQRDHLARALFLARHAGIEAWGIAARGNNYGGLYGTLVGNLSSLRAYVDLVERPFRELTAADVPR